MKQYPDAVVSSLVMVSFRIDKKFRKKIKVLSDRLGITQTEFFNQALVSECARIERAESMLDADAIDQLKLYEH
jgi:hypothetical protein